MIPRPSHSLVALGILVMMALGGHRAGPTGSTAPPAASAFRA